MGMPSMTTSDSRFAKVMSEEKAHQDLMSRIARGDHRAYETVVDLYMGDVFRFSYALLKNTQKAEDTTQETFLRLWNKAERWNPSGSLKSWLMRIAHNLCMDDLRSGLRFKMQDVDDVVLQDVGPTPHETQGEGEISSIIKTALFEMPERQRAAIMLVYYEGYNQTQASEIMGMTLDGFESLLTRGRQKLKLLLGDKKSDLLEG